MPDEVQIPRDVRVDHIGFVDELKKHLADDLRSAVKVRMTDDSLGKVTGSYFEAALVDGYDVSTIDPAKLLKMYEKGEIKKGEFLSAIKVQNEPAKKFLSGKQIADMSSSLRGQPQLRITRIKGVEILLVDAVKGLGTALAEAK